ncbi:MAG: hypothetical protein ACLT46_05960 [Hungatella sp.]
MLKKPCTEKEGADVVIGYLAPEMTEEACKLAEGLENLGSDRERKQTEEFDSMPP